jgi:hypothetical protein
MALDLGKQIGPLPLGAWLAVTAGGLGIAWYSMRDGGGIGTDEDIIEPEIVEDISGDEGVGEGGFVYTPPPVVTPGPTPIIDNDQWATEAIKYLIEQNYDSAMANQAITIALSGDRKLSAREWTLWRIALMKLGSPPFPVIVEQRPSTPVTPPKPKPKPKPQPKITGRWFRVKPAFLPGSSLRGIAKMAYGDPKKWDRIYNANKWGKKLPHYPGDPKKKQRRGQIRNPNALRTGALLYIPRG